MRKSSKMSSGKTVYIQLTGPVVTPRWLSIKQLCAYLGGMKPRHAADLLRHGEIQFHLVGKQKMVDRADADAWANKQPFFTGKLSKNGKPMSDEDAQKVIERVRQNDRGFVVNISAPALAETPDPLYKKKVRFTKPESIAKIKAAAKALGKRVSDKQLEGITSYEEWSID